MRTLPVIMLAVFLTSCLDIAEEGPCPPGLDSVQSGPYQISAIEADHEWPENARLQVDRDGQTLTVTYSRDGATLTEVWAIGESTRVAEVPEVQ